MEKRELTCIVCPNGCTLGVEIEGEEVINVTGNACLRGYAYAQTEIQHPVRVVTSTVEVTGGAAPRVSVKTKREIPKDKVMECAELLKGVKVNAPISIGDVIIENAAGTHVDVVATAHVEKERS